MIRKLKEYVSTLIVIIHVLFPGVMLNRFFLEYQIINDDIRRNNYGL